MRAIDADTLRERLQNLAYDDWNQGITTSFADACHEIIDIIEEQPTIEPSAQPEVKEIGYAECANAMLKMWMDNVLTDGEYNRIMDKLNAHHDAERRQNG